MMMYHKSNMSFLENRYFIKQRKLCAKTKEIDETFFLYIVIDFFFERNIYSTFKTIVV